jgi:hypothetical protein
LLPSSSLSIDNWPALLNPLSKCLQLIKQKQIEFMYLQITWIKINVDNSSLFYFARIKRNKNIKFKCQFYQVWKHEKQCNLDMKCIKINDYIMFLSSDWVGWMNPIPKKCWRRNSGKIRAHLLQKF